MHSDWLTHVPRLMTSNHNALFQSRVFTLFCFFIWDCLLAMWLWGVQIGSCRTRIIVYKSNVLTTRPTPQRSTHLKVVTSSLITLNINHSQPLSIQVANMKLFNTLNVSVGSIRTADISLQKRLFCQLCHGNCPQVF